MKESGGTHQVYLVSGYNMRGCTIWLTADVAVAVWGSAFKDVRTEAASEGGWVVDSLIDGDYDKRGPFRGGEGNPTCRTHVMYSEQMGGLDVGNASWANPGDDNTKQGAMALLGGDGASGYHYRENNKFYTEKFHRTSIIDNEGDIQTLPNSPAPPASLKAEINARVDLIETWANQVRAAAGADTTPIPDPDPPADGRPDPPVLLLD